MKLRFVAFFVALFSVLGLTSAQAITYPDAAVNSATDAPWVVSMWMVDESFDRAPDGFLCTGSLLDAYTVIIAAHCIAAAQNQYGYVFVRAQSSSTSRGEVLIPRQSIVHPDYDPANPDIAGDIAIVDLYYPSSVKTFLKIPSPTMEKFLRTRRPTLYGWGLMENGGQTDVLRKAKLRWMTTKAQAAYDTFDSNLQLAAGRVNPNGTFTGACAGDSGGPLTSAYRGVTYILAIVSYGEGAACESASPTVFTRVRGYRSFVSSAEAELKKTRLQKQVRIKDRHFVNSKANPLLNQSGITSGLKFQQYRADFVTETMGEAQSDLKWMTVTSFQSVADQWDVDVTLHSKIVWENAACGLGAAFHSVDDFISENVPGQVSVYVRAARSWQSQYVFTYSATEGSCIAEEGISLQPQSLTGSPVAEGCEAAIYGNNDGSLSFQFTRQCFPNPQYTYLRIQQNSFGVSDIEPGYDLWVGALNLKSP